MWCVNPKNQDCWLSTYRNVAKCDQAFSMIFIFGPGYKARFACTIICCEYTKAYKTWTKKFHHLWEGKNLEVSPTEGYLQIQYSLSYRAEPQSIVHV